MFNRGNFEKLINCLEGLTYCDRLSEIIKLGKQEREEPKVVSLIDTLQAYAAKSTGKDWRFVAYFNTVISRLAELHLR
ncbi:MAG: hypothetical protein AB4368_32805 [Xenococcaceae cyanobacterium]